MRDREISVLAKVRLDRVAAARELFWVCVYPRGRATSMSTWRFGVGEDSRPDPVPNIQMEWRRPTFEELLDRQVALYLEGPQYQRGTPKFEVAAEDYLRVKAQAQAVTVWHSDRPYPG